MIKAHEVSKSYSNKEVIKNFSLEVEIGDFIAITGESGKGKTTVLNILGLLEMSDSGTISVNNIVNPKKRQKMLLQRHSFSYLFQNYALIENETVEENLKIALAYRKKVDKKFVIEEALEFANLHNVMGKKIFQLSGGEQQRVALSRAYIKCADYVFADEPTGNLDLKNRDIVFELLRKLNKMGKAVVFATHDATLANQANKQVSL